jgi:Ca2+-binding RTX toxin-like protein
MVVGFLVLGGVVAAVPAGAQVDGPLVPGEVVEPFVAGDDVEFTEAGDGIDVDVVGNDLGGDDEVEVVVEIVAAPAGGSAVVAVDGGEPVVRYVPDGGFEGVESFGYRGCVGADCDEAIVTVFVGSSGCTVVGTGGADVLTGTSGDDVICGRGGDDVIDAGGGRDLVLGGGGADTILGGGGPDTLLGGPGRDVIDGGAGPDVVRGGRGDDVLSGSGNDDRLFGGRGDDLLRGNAGQDLLVGKRGDDELRGGRGNDRLRGWRGEDALFGGDGDDLLWGGRDGDRLVGGAGDDELWGRRGPDVLSGGGGDDALFGNRGTDDLDGGPGSDRLDGGNGDDACRAGEEYSRCETTGEPPVVEAWCWDELATIVGTEGPDTLAGTAGPDVIAGLGGDDVIDGLDGDDVICGGDGNDTIRGGPGADLVDGGVGVDAVDGDDGDDSLSGGDGADQLDGGVGSDYLSGDGGSDRADGGPGRDAVLGGAGDDDLVGGDGDDQLHGGEGDDSADGGAGSDRCVLVETAVGCEEELSTPGPLDVVVGPVELPAGVVVFEAPEGVDPVRVEMESLGGLSGDDVSIRANYPAAALLGDALVSPVYELDLDPEATPFVSAELTIPYRADYVGSTDETDLRIVRFDTAAGRWRVVPGPQSVDPAADTVTATITGFSTYAVIRYPSIEALLAGQLASGRLDDVVAAQAGCAVAPYGDVVTADGPVSYWPFDPADPLADAVGVRDLSGVPTLLDPLVPATDDGAARFVAGDQPPGGPGVSDETGLWNQDFAFEMWMRDSGGSLRADLGGAVLVGDSGDVSGPEATVMLSDGTLRFATPPGAQLLHLVVEKGGDLVRFYVNGALVGEQSTGGAPVAFTGSYLTLPTVSGFGGDLDEIAVYDSPLGAAAVARHYNTGLAVQDGDGDELADCEEQAGLFSLAHLGFPGDAGAFRLDPDDPDVDDDGLKDGQELIGEPVATTDLLSESERQLLAGAGLVRVYRMRSDPTKVDSDGDGIDDWTETLNDLNADDGWDPLIPDPNDFYGLDYPRDTLFQPAVFGVEPFINPIVRLSVDRSTGEAINRVTTTYFNSPPVLFDAEFDCVSNCDSLNEFALGAVDPDLAELGVIPCYFNGDDGQCSNLEDAARSRLLVMLDIQRVFDPYFFSPHRSAVTGEVIGGHVYASCAVFNGDDPDSLVVPCEGPSGQPVAGLEALPLTALSRTGLQDEFFQRVRTEATPRLNLSSTGTLQPTDAALRRWARYMAPLLGPVLLTGDSPEDEVFDRTKECLRVTNLPAQAAILATMPTQLIARQVPNVGIVMQDPCRGLPVYFPGSDLGQATTHRVNAIIDRGHPALLSHRTRAQALAAMGISSDWYQRVEFGPCDAPGLACDEYPNLASGESGPNAYQERDIPFNNRTASLCLMNRADNYNEGFVQYGPFKRRNGMRTATVGVGRYFLVIPYPDGVTTSIDVPASEWSRQPVRPGQGSYPPPPGIGPDDYEGAC